MCKAPCLMRRRFASLTASSRYFGELAHHRWMKTYTGVPSTPQTIVYTFGNPLIAQSMLRYDLVGTLHIPPKLVLIETPGGGTKVIYDDPATTIPVPVVSGGYVFNDEDGNPLPAPQQAGPGVRGLLRDREFLDLMSMSRLFPESQAGEYGKPLA